MTTGPSDRASEVWMFGYGSLVDPVELGLYVGYTPTKGVDWVPAFLTGYERNWDVGMKNLHKRTDDKFYLAAGGDRFAGVILSLGLEPSKSQRTNGVVFRTEARFLPALDKRERRYDRLDVTRLVVTAFDLPAESVVYVYLPKVGAVATAKEAVAAWDRRGASCLSRQGQSRLRTSG